MVDGGKYASPGRIWLDRESFELDKERRDLDLELRRLASSLGRPLYSLEKLRQVVAILRDEKAPE